MSTILDVIQSQTGAFFDKKSVISSISSETDTGSYESQIALLTARIHYLTNHLKTNKKDKLNKRSLILLVNRRNKLLKKLSKVNYERFSTLANKLAIRISSRFAK